MKYYTLDVTYECNWFCPYCVCDTHSQLKRSFETVLEKLKEVENDSILSLSGGEPGMLSEDQLKQIVKIAKEKNCRLEVITNGTIFNYPKICKDIDLFYYHCSIDLNHRGQVNKKYKDKCFFTVNAYDSNMSRITKFFEVNSDIAITIVPTVEAIVQGVKGPSLSRENAQKILDRAQELKLSDINIGLLQRYVETGLVISDEPGERIAL